MNRLDCKYINRNHSLLSKSHSNNCTGLLVLVEDRIQIF